MASKRELLGIYRRLWMVCPDPVPDSWARLIAAFTAELRLRGIESADMVAAAREGIARSAERVEVTA
jgi:hypothetical protein